MSSTTPQSPLARQSISIKIKTAYLTSNTSKQLDDLSNDVNDSPLNCKFNMFTERVKKPKRVIECDKPERKKFLLG